jgi:GntR family transcriptional regulator, transcriptional repressor for pyruvate dehydrogenase complex
VRQRIGEGSESAASTLAPGRRGASINGGEPLADTVARDLAKFIAASGLSPGNRLPAESDLAAKFGVSVRVAREALRKLTEYGIVRTSQGRRAEVSYWQPQSIRRFFEFAGYIGATPLELLELRFALEPHAAALAALRATDDDLVAIDNAIGVMASANNGLEQFVSGDTNFHGAVVRSTHNPFFSMIVDGLSQSLRDERMQGVRERIRQGRTHLRSIKEHKAIAEAIRAHDTKLAELRTREHLERGLTYIRGSQIHRSTRSRPTRG